MFLGYVGSTRVSTENIGDTDPWPNYISLLSPPTERYIFIYYYCAFLRNKGYISLALFNGFPEDRRQKKAAMKVVTSGRAAYPYIYIIYGINIYIIWICCLC